MKKYLKLLIAILIVLAVVALFKAFYSVQEDEYALLMRFDKVIDVKSDAGLHMKIPFIDSSKS